MRTAHFLGRYRVVEEIGTGGMASVHLGRMDGPGGFQKWVAIKRIHPHLVEDDQFVDMFLDEARIAAGISHANVAQVFDLGKDESTYWIAMEYLHGETLREIMRRIEEFRAVVPPELAARICADAAEGLHAAHELRGKNGQLLGLVHRDVTPHNLFITYEGYTKVVDFGIAKVADRLSSTRAGTLKGKLAYMSPEQVRGGEIDRRTDIFALGVVLWEMTTGRRLFRMDTDLDTLEKVQACVVPPPSTVIRGYPVELESVVMKALAKRKEDRFQTAREFSRALQGVLMQRGAFVAAEEVASFLRQMFGERIKQRDEHLARASELTGFNNVAPGGLAPEVIDEVSAISYEPSGAAASAGAYPAAGGGVMAAASLMDDDDAATTVASREEIVKASHERQVPRPAAGLPAPAPQGPPARRAPVPTMLGLQAPQFPGAPNYSPQPPAAPAASAAAEDDAEDLGSTVALPRDMSDIHAKIAEAERARQQAAGYPAPPQPVGYGGYAPQQGVIPQPSAAAAPPPAQSPYNPYGAPAPYNPYAQGGAQGYPYPQGIPPQGMPQSAVETVMSAPRPDAAALWMAQQEAAKQKPQRKGMLVFIAVGLFASLCVGGVVALFHARSQANSAPAPVDSAAPVAPSEAPTAAVAVPEPPPTAEPAASTLPAAVTAEPTAAPTAEPTAAPTAAPVAPAPTPKVATPTPPAHTTPPAPTPAAPPKDEPGYLTIVCTPTCDNVSDGGRSLGPSPIVHLAAKPGQHRITLKRESIKKTISVIVVSGQVTAQRVSMK